MGNLRGWATLLLIALAAAMAPGAARAQGIPVYQVGQALRGAVAVFARNGSLIDPASCAAGGNNCYPKIFGQVNPGLGFSLFSAAPVGTASYSEGQLGFDGADNGVGSLASPGCNFSVNGVETPCGGSASAASPLPFTVTPGTSIQTQLTAAGAAGGGTVLIRAGAYTATQSLLVSSGTKVQCEPGAAITANSVGWVHTTFPNLTVNNNAIWVNVNNTAGSLTDSNIEISGCHSIAAGTFATDGNFFHVYMRRVQHVHIDGGNVFEGGGDATAFLASDDTLVADNYAQGVLQCWDHWEAPKRAKVHGGYCNPGGITNAIGALFTGTDTTGTLAGAADDFELIGGTYVMGAGTGGVGIWVMGLATGAGASHVRIIKPYIDMTGRTGDNVCTRATGNGTDITIDVMCKGGTGPAVEVDSAGDAGGFPTFYTVSAEVHDLNTTGPAFIMGGSNGLLTNSLVVGGIYSYIASGSGLNVKVSTETVNAGGGTSGLYQLTGAGSSANSFLSTVGTISSKTVNYSVQYADTGTRFDNFGAAGSVTFTLPALPVTPAGLNYCFAVSAAQTVVVKANTANFIAIGASESASGGNITATTQYAAICVENHASGQWITYSTPDRTQWTVN